MLQNDTTILSYEDYRDFLSHRLQELKASNPKISYEFLSRKLGLTRGFLNHVINKKRHLALEKIGPVADYFCSSGMEKQYFTFLFLKNVCGENTIEKYFSDVLAALKFRLTTNQPFIHQPYSSGAIAALSGWLVQSIIALADLKDFKPEAEWIAEKLIVSAADRELIPAALEVALKSGAVQQVDGKWKSVSVHGFVEAFDIDHYKSFQSAMRRTIEATEDISTHQPLFFNAIAMSVSPETEPKLKEIYARFSKDLFEIAEKETDPKRIFLITNCFCRVST